MSSVECRLGIITLSFMKLGVGCWAFFAFNVGCQMKNFGKVGVGITPFMGPIKVAETSENV